MNPLFPEFKLISIEEKQLFKAFTDKYDSYSDFNLLSLLSWNADHNNSFTVLNNNLVIRIKDYLNDAFVYSLLGEKLLDESISQLLTITDSIKFVPEFIANCLGSNKYSVSEDRDSYDYIIDVCEFYNLQTSQYRNIRKNIHLFEKKFPSVLIKNLDLTSKHDCDLVLNLTNDWGKKRGSTDTETASDVQSTLNFINNSRHFNTFSLGLFESNKLIAFSFNELLNSTWAMGHFGKSDIEYGHSMMYMEYMTSKYLCEKGFKYNNLQQDTGLPNLRVAKMEYHPKFFLKKYIVKSL